MPVPISPREVLSRLFLLLILAAGTCAGQVDTQTLIEDVFRAGLASFRQGRYGEALSSFEVILSGSGRNHRTTAASIMAAKAAYRSRDYGRARRHATELLRRYPRSGYADHALYLRALSDYRLGDYAGAGDALVRLAVDYPASGFTSRSDALLRDILETHLPSSELRRFVSEREGDRMSLRVRHALAVALAREGRDSLAVSVLDTLLREPLDDSVRSAFTALRDDLAAGEKLQIGVLLPLMEEGGSPGIRRISQEVLDGIRYALDQHNMDVTPGRQVEILLRDTGGDSAVAGSLVAGMVPVDRIRGVVGPLFTDEFTAAAHSANDSFLPIISPTATGEGIAELGPFIFQANPDYSTRGRAAARYAVQNLGMSSFAVLASDDIVGRAHAEAFQEEAGRLGATVYCAAYFHPESEDLREAYTRIRRSVMAESTLVRRSDIAGDEMLETLTAMGIDPRMSHPDSGAADTTDTGYISVTSLLGPRGYVLAESLGIPIAAYDTTADETDIPLVGLDAVFIPLGDPRQMDYVAPQLNYFNIRAQIIGNNEWYDPERLAANREYVDGALFVSDSYIDDADTSIARFTAAFTSRRGRQPSKFTFYGYDTMELLLGQLREGARSRMEIARHLSEVNGYRGYHSTVSLARGRVNGDLHVLQFTGGAVVRFGEAAGSR